jgi:hypothetical protein
MADPGGLFIAALTTAPTMKSEESQGSGRWPLSAARAMDLGRHIRRGVGVLLLPTGTVLWFGARSLAMKLPTPSHLSGPLPPAHGPRPRQYASRPAGPTLNSSKQ